MKKQNVLMIGCGKLGLPCAEVMSRFHNIQGYDITPFSSQHVEYTNDLKNAITKNDIIFIAVPTPHDKNYGGEKPTAHLEPKDFDYSYIISVLKQIHKHITLKQTVVLISTVLPGTIRNYFKPFINSKNFIYNPYLIAMGSVKEDMVSPECIIVGNYNGKHNYHSKKIINFYKQITINKPEVNFGTWEEAESIKIFYNTFISLKLSFVNMVQDVAQSIGNINVDVVVDALKNAKQRIVSTKYMTPGLGDGGACHPRDNIALRFLAKKQDLGYDLFQSIVESREQQMRNIAKYVAKIHKKTKLPIVIHGMTYKSGVVYSNGSCSLLIEHYLHTLNCKCLCVDPLLERNNITPTTPSIVFLAHPASNTNSLYFKPRKGSIIIDPWRKFNIKTRNYTVLHYGNTRELC
jgi:UDPglucose 6-dehydrogenase